MKAPGRLVRAALLSRVLVAIATLGLVLGLFGCERQIAPPLVDVTELGPREVEPGDRLEVRGAGFPQGRAGKLTLEGTAFRPGEPPVRVSLEADGTVVTPDRLEVVVRDGFAERLCGRGDRASHATFRGDLEVAFASTNQGAPPLVGTLRGVVLDVQPASTRASVLDARTAEGRRLLGFLGITPGAPTPRGIPVEQVEATSAAARAGIQVGDVLVGLDGVHVLALADLLPASARSADFAIRHGDSGLEEVKSLALLEFSSERVPAEYVPALLLVAIGLVTLLLVLLPGPPSLATLEMRVAAHARRTNARALLAHLFGTGRQAAVSALLSAAIAGIALTPYVVSREIDGVVLFATGACLLVWSRLADLRRHVRTGRLLPILGGIVLAVLAMVGAIALAVVQIGAIELAEIARVQGGAPWTFSGARYPACAVLVIVYAAAIVGIARTTSPPAPTPAGTTAKPRPALLDPRLLQRTGVLLLSAVGVTAFFGGWQLPGLGDPHGRSLLFAGAALFVGKTWFATALLLGMTAALPHAERAGAGRLVRLVGLRLLPGLVLAGGLILATRRFVPSSGLETVFGATVVGLVALFLVRTTGRVRAAMGRPEPHASPFL